MLTFGGPSCYDAASLLGFSSSTMLPTYPFGTRSCLFPGAFSSCFIVQVEHIIDGIINQAVHLRKGQKGGKMNHGGVIWGNVTPDSPLRRWRRKHGHTQAWLARRCGVTVTTVARWEKAEQRGGRQPTSTVLLCLLDVTGLPAESLIFPERYLQDHPTFLSAWASEPQRRGRPKRPPEA
jgi:transcriptional regulator with XRE-family HTH domain